MSNKVEYWLQLAEYDFETAKSLLEKKRYLHVLVFCQQTCEKALKALYAHKFGKVPPKIHNLTELVDKIGIKLEREDLLKLQQLKFFYIEARYPADITGLDQIDRDTAVDFYEYSEGFVEWIKSQLI